MAVTPKSPHGGLILSGSSPVTFTAGAALPQASSNVSVLWDFDNDGDWDEAEEDITEYVLAAQTGYGRDYPAQLTGRSGPGAVRLTLRNDDDRFSYFNSDSPLVADPFSLKTGRRIRIEATDGVLGAAAISYVGIGAVANASNASVTPALPTGLRSAELAPDGNADLMIVMAAIRNSGTGTVVVPDGWALLLAFGNVSFLGRYYEDGDVAPVVTFAGGVANATTQAQCFAFRGVHQTMSKAFVASATQLNASAANIAVPGLVATVKAWMPDPDQVAMVVAAWKQDDWTSVAQLSGQFFTEISDSPTTLGDDSGIELQYRLGAFANAKTFTSTSLTVTGGASAISRAIVFALAPAVDVAGPTLLAADGFQRPTSPTLGNDDLGNAWTTRSGSGFGVTGGDWGRAAPLFGTGATTGTNIISTVDTGETDHYVQASVVMQVQDGRVGLVARYLDTSNYVRAYYSNVDRAVIIEQVVAGSVSTLGLFNIEAWDGMALGLEVRNAEVIAYIGGTPLTFTDRNYVSRALTGTHAGLYGRFETHSDVAPQLDDFEVWDRVGTPIDGVIFTGTVKSVKTSVKAGDLKVVEVECQGPLAGAAGIEVAAPRIMRLPNEFDEGSGANHSVPAGCIVGDLMARAGLLSPPHPLPSNPLSHIGPVGIKDGKALELARLVELTERGFIRETPEGYIAFEDRDYRAGLSSKAWFSDTAGAGQYHFEEIEPLDHEGQIINRAVAAVAPSAPTVEDVSNQGDDDASLDVVITVPAVRTGQLVLVFIASSAQADGVNWLKPAPWEEHRNQGDDFGMRIYSLVADGTETGSSVQFYKGDTEGTFIAHIYVIDNWYGTNDGIKIGRVSSGAFGGNNAYPISPGWDRDPALFVVFQCAIGASSGILWGPLDAPPPVGYDYLSLEGLVFVTATPAYETGVESIYKMDVVDTEDPRAWTAVFEDYLLLESVVVAIRGFNGALEKATIEDPKAVGSEGTIVALDDVASQADHRFIRQNPDVPELLYDKAAARSWCESVLADFAEDRAIITLSFTASRDTALRGQALRRRVSDKITVTASGRAGLGIEGDFFIEHVHHAWSNGMTRWVTTWELSPA